MSGWAVPSPFGAPSAVQSLSGTAAPLLAGFSLTMATLILQAPNSFRLAGPTLFVLIVAVVLMLTCVQCGFWARHYFAAPDEVSSWFGDYDSDPDRQARVQEEQRTGYAAYRRWADLARLTYAVGIVCVYSALALAVVPASGSPDFGFRVAAAGLLMAAAASEVIWSIVAWKQPSRRRLTALKAVRRRGR